jgi:hypothetical protein
MLSSGCRRMGRESRSGGLGVVNGLTREGMAADWDGDGSSWSSSGLLRAMAGACAWGAGKTTLIVPRKWI